MTDFYRQARLTDAARTREGEEAAVRILNLLDDGAQLMLAPKKRRERKGQIGGYRLRKEKWLRRGRKQRGLEAIDHLFLARHLHEQLVLLSRDFQMLRQEFSHLARDISLVGFDLEDQRCGATHPVAKLLLRKSQCFASALNPGTK